MASTTHTSQESSGLKIGIVGAGVAGLCAAIALRRAGHECEIYERSQFRNEVGAAVSIPPNGGRILKRWGYDHVKAQGIDMIQVRRPKGSDLTPMAPTINFSDVEQKYGNRWFFYHRVDMHKQLREMASSDSLPGKAGIIHLGSQVMDVDPEEGIIYLKDGTQVQKDLVIIADGQHDRLNAKITGVDIPMQRSGQTAYRCLIPMKEILEDEVTKPLFENQAHGFWAPALPPKGVMCVTYPCRNGEILNCLIVHRKLGQHASSEDEQTIEDWNFPASPEQLEAVLEGFHPAVRTLMLKSPEIKMYTQMKRQPLPKMFKGKALLIGDACHPMLLTHAQGVSSSIEDSAALEVMFSNIPGSKSVTDAPSAALTSRLELFEKFRLPRVSATQIMTDPIPPGPKAAELQAKMETEIRKYYDGPLPPSNSVPHSPAICDFFFAYDVTAEAEKLVATHRLNGLEQEVSQLSVSSGQQKKEADVTVATAPTTASVPQIVTPTGTAADKLAETNVTEVTHPTTPPTETDASTGNGNGNATLGKDLTVKNLYLRLKKSLSFDSLRKRASVATTAKSSNAA